MQHRELLEKLDPKPYGYGNNILEIVLFDMCYMLIGNPDFIEEFKIVMGIDLTDLIVDDPIESAEKVFAEEETVLIMLDYVIETKWGALDEK